MADAGARPAIVVTIADDEHEVDVLWLHAGRPDLEMVDALMHLRLSAGRRGWRVQLRDAPDELRGLLELVGLDELLDQ